MKMDAMQKRRMWKVAIAYFFLSAFVLWKAFNYAGWEAPLKQDIWFIVWRSFWIKILVALQPFWFFINKINIPIPDYLILILWLISIPIWSICFGWLYVKFTNWLNHFPVLGKKVF
jgi:hypothetical protein